MKIGLAGSQANPLVSGLLCYPHFSFNLFQANPLVVFHFFVDKVLIFIGFSDLCESEGGGVGVGIESDDLGFSKWLNSIQGKPGLCFFIFCFLILNISAIFFCVHVFT